MNKANNLFLSSVLVLLATAGCTSHKIEVAPVKTEHEIKPIHITMDINLKVVDQELDKYTEAPGAAKPSAKAAKAKDDSKEALRARFIARKEALADLKKRGIVGESATGYLSYVTKSNEKEDLVRAENRDRRTVYKKIAEKQNATRDEIAARAALKRQERALSGEYILKDGKWIKK